MKNEEDHFDLLRKIQKQPDASQRDLARELGFSLGKLNYCLKALQKKALSNSKIFTNNQIKFVIYNILLRQRA
jgi:predicted transcriptional regulator